MMPSAFSPQVSVQKLPHLAVTLGDPAGIGPEVVLKALADSDITHNCQITVVGSRDLLRDTYHKLAAGKLTEPLADPEKLHILDVPGGGKIISGAGDAASGAASFVWMEAAIKSTLAGEFQGIVTGPIAKSCWQAAGHHYPGQTELLADRAKVQRFGMLFVAKSPHSRWTFRTLLATTHIPLRQVPETLNPDLLTAKLDLLIECLRQDFRIPNPRIAIAGLNPHSGEGGQLGTEERDWLIPWLQQMQRRHPGIQLDGPVPPDTLWVKAGQAWYDPKTTAHDAYLAMYHDQGLIPVKLLAFDAAVNTTIGLPFIRTSPDHGTAFDIAGKGVANPASMKAAIKLAAELAHLKFLVGL